MFIDLTKTCHDFEA